MPIFTEKPKSQCSKKELEARLELEARMTTKVYEMHQKHKKAQLQAYKDIMIIRRLRKQIPYQNN